MVDISRTKGLGTFAITDHYSEFSNLPPRMTKEQLVPYLAALDHAGVIKGVEADVLSDGVSITAQSAKLCDLVLGGLHILQGIIFWFDHRPIVNPASFVESVRVALIKAIESELLDVLAHPTGFQKQLDLKPNN